MSTETSLIVSAFRNTNNLTLTPADPNERAALANIREVFFSRDAVNTAKILKSDLTTYMSQLKANSLRLVIMDELIPSFLRQICNVYDVPPVYKWEEEGSEDKADALRAFWNDLGIATYFQENCEMMRFNNVSISLVKWNEALKRTHIDGTFHAGNSIIESFPGFVFEAKKLTYFRGVDPDKWAFVWELLELNEDGTAKTNHYKYKLDKGGKIPKVPVYIAINPDNAEGDLSGPDYWPVVVHRYSERGATFWGNAMDSLVELVRAINVLFSVCNDDTIRQSIRILIFNFRPVGSEDDDGNIEAGMENPIMPEGGIGKNDMKGEILEAKLFNKEVIGFVEALFGIVSNTHNIGSLLKQDLKEALSGLALRLKNEPLLRDWAHDINIVRQPDMRLLSTLVRVDNYHRKGDKAEGALDQKLADSVQVDYQEPNLVTDDQSEYELEKLKWPDGTSSPVLWVMARNPEFTEDQAKEWIQNNINDYEELQGLKVGLKVKEEVEEEEIV